MNSNNAMYNTNQPLPTPPQQQSALQHNTGGPMSISANNTGNSGSGRAGLPLPPLPNPPGQQQQSAFYTGQTQSVSSTPLPGSLPNTGYNNSQQQQGQGHMQQASYTSNTGGYGGQQMYNGQQQQQPQGMQYQGGPWQQQQQGLQPSYMQQQYTPGPPSHTPVPQAGAYPYPPQVQTPWQ